MWNSLEQAAKKAAHDAKKVTSKVKTTFSGMDKKKGEEPQEEQDDNNNNNTSHNKNIDSDSPKSKANFNPFSRVEADADGEGDMSKITWADGSVKQMPSLRVFGKSTTIVVADELKISSKRENNKKSENNDGDTSDNNNTSDNTSDTNNDTNDGVGGNNNVERKLEGDSSPQSKKVNLPVLIFPGMASSGLQVEESGLHPKFKGRRLWMNAGFLATSAMTNTVVSSSATNDSPNTNSYIPEHEMQTSFVGNVEHQDRDKSNNSNHRQDSEYSMNDADIGVEFAKIEDELQIRSAWLYHIALDKNMVDERPGNRVRTYDGIKACEWLVDDALGKPAAVVWADMIQFLEKEMGYIRGKNLDAAPYDWRLPPMSTEARDGYLTKTMQKVETMYNESGGLPIVMCCHSMGCKMGHYFLNFCLQEKGREWIDQHIHTYMPVGAPHCGAPLTLKLGATGAGLLGLIDDVMISLDEGVTMYRSWGSGPWLIPRDLPHWVFPPCIVRREGELGIKISSEIDVGLLFADREKPPKELRLTIIFRDKIQVSTDFCPLVMDGESNPASMIVSFEETFYLAVPYLEDGTDELGSLVFFLEEPSSGGQYHNYESKTRTQLRNATKWARGFKKNVTKLYRSVAKRIGPPLQVAVCEKPIEMKVSTFAECSSTTVDGTPVIESVIPFCRCKGSNSHRNNENSENQEEESNSDIADNHQKEYHVFEDGQQEERMTAPYVFDFDQQDKAIGSLSVYIRYNPPPNFQKHASKCTTKFAVMPQETPVPPVVSRKTKSNTISHEKIVYDAWNGCDVLDQDGFCKNMFDLHEEYYEQDSLGPTTKSALDAPPVNIVRSIYGINVPTEVSAVYRKNPVVIIGDSKADCRFQIDTSAGFAKFDANSTDPKAQKRIVDPRVEEMLKGYQLKDGIVKEIPETLQHVPGTTEKRRCCGDGTVPYWSLVHCLKWKDAVPTLTIDELEGAIHRSILSDKRFHALLQQHCTVDDPRLPESTTSLAVVNSRISGLGLATVTDIADLKAYV